MLDRNIHDRVVQGVEQLCVCIAYFDFSGISVTHWLVLVVGHEGVGDLEDGKLGCEGTDAGAVSV